MKQEIKNKIDNYIEYLLKNSTIEKPIWNQEVLIGLKKPGWTYIDGCMMVALDKLYQHNKDENLFNYIESFFSPLVKDDGRVDLYFYNNYNTYTTTGYDSDTCNMAKVLFTLYEKTNNEKYRRSIDFFMNEQLRKIPRIRGNFWHKIKYYNQIWLDGLYMILPFYAMYTKKYEDSMGFYDIVYQLENAGDLTWDESRSLNVHGYDGQYIDKDKIMPWANPTNGQSSVVWLRANGWYIMALVDVYEIIDDLILKNIIKNRIIKVVDGLLKYIDNDSHMFYQVVDEGSRDGNYLETSGSLMIAYSILKACRLNALDSSYKQTGLDIFYGTIDKYFYYNDGHYNLGGICLGAGLSANRDDKNAGSYQMYIDRAVVENDGKGISPLILAYVEALKAE